MTTRKLTRRDFGLGAGAALLALATRPRRSFAAPLAAGPLEVEPLPRGGAWAVGGGGGNSLLVPTADGPILIDAKSAPTAMALRAETSSRAGRAPALLINTHHHADHTGGNFAFSAESEIVAHANLGPRLPATIESRVKPALAAHVDELESAGSRVEAGVLRRALDGLTVDDFAPDRQVDEELELEFGGVRVHLMHFGPGHTDNDVAVFLPKANVLHTGDLLFYKLHPFIDRAANASTRGWQAALVALVKKCNDRTIVIPGHGARTNLNGMVMQHYYFQRLRDIVGEEMRLGRTREQITAMRPEEFRGLGFTRFRAKALGAMYDELAQENGG